MRFFAVMMFALVAGPALADPCEAPLPTLGQAFSGEVRYVLDGDGLCVGTTANPRTWIEVRLADFDAPEIRDYRGPEAKLALRRLVEGRRITCRVVRGRYGSWRSYDRVIAACTLRGRPLGDALRAEGDQEGGR